tara:strand:- start:420 stop:758 length:339 start_codon:yes stop_codon:yes gene_type:complete
MMSQMMFSKGLMDRIDVSSLKETILLFKGDSFEESGLFQTISMENEELTLIGKFDKSIDVFKIYNYKSLKAIIKYSNTNIIIDIDIDKITITDQADKFIVGIGAKNYEIKTL